MNKIPFQVLTLLLPLTFFSNTFLIADTDQKVLHYINQYLPETRNLLADSTTINSGTLYKTGVKVKGYLRA